MFKRKTNSQLLRSHEEASQTTFMVTGVRALRKRSGSAQIMFATIVVAVMVMMAMTLAGCSGDEGIAPKSSTNEYSWDELSQISQEIGKAADENAAIEVAKKYNLTTEDGKLDGTQTKDVTLSDDTQTSVQIAGFYHDDKSDGSGKAGITFIFTDAIAAGRDMNSTPTNVGGWERSQMRSWLSSDGMKMLPEDLQSAIVAVDKLTNNVGETTSTSSVTKTSDKLWLYAPIELCGEVDWYDGSYSPCNDVLNAEGTQYQLYLDAGITNVYGPQNVILEKTYDGSSSGWWGRSPDPYSSDYFYFVSSDGNPYFIVVDYGSNGVVPGFCL